MTISIDEETGKTKLTADDGKAIHRKGTPTPCSIIGALLRPSDSPDNWEDCELGEPTPPEPEEEEATEADKDAALSQLGVDMTEGV